MNVGILLASTPQSLVQVSTFPSPPHGIKLDKNRARKEAEQAAKDAAFEEMEPVRPVANIASLYEPTDAEEQRLSDYRKLQCNENIGLWSQ